MKLDTSPHAVPLIGAIQGLYQAGGLLGTLYVGLSGDMLGRRLAICIASVACIVGGALQTGSVHVAMFMVARFISGLGIGAHLVRYCSCRLVVHFANDSWTHSRCPCHFDSFMAERGCTAQDPRVPCGSAWYAFVRRQNRSDLLTWW